MVYRIFEAVMQLGSSNARLLGGRKTNSSAIGCPEFLKSLRSPPYVEIPKVKVLTHQLSSKYNHSKRIWEENLNEST